MKNQVIARRTGRYGRRWGGWIALLLLAIFWPFSPVGAGSFPTDPVLRIEAGMHVSTIRRLAVDGKFQFLVTVADDKTIRIWSPRDGRLLKTIHAPIGTGGEGKLFAAAVSPDGKLLAVGGWTGWEWDGSVAIYLFDIHTGQMTRRITGLSNVVNHLAFSKDGNLLAVGLAKNHGIRVFKTANGEQVGTDSEYGDHCYWLDFDANDRLVTTSYDGFIRLYDAKTKLLIKRQAPEEDRPFAAVFSPDSKAIAVGYSRSNRVEVLSAVDLNLLYAPDIAGVNGKLHSVAWSLKGHYLYAAGLHSVNDQRAIRRWDKAGKPDENGRSHYVDYPVSQDTLFHLLPLPDNRLVFSAADPTFGLLKENGELAFIQKRPTAVFRSIGDQFLVATDGSRVQFSYEAGGGNLHLFAVPELTIIPVVPGEPAHATMKPPIVVAEEFPDTGWVKDGFAIGGHAITLKNHEVVQSFAIAPDKRFIVVGTNFYLRLFGKDAREIWQIPTASTVWAVNIPEKNDQVVALLGNGTIRWLQMADGKDMLTFFPHNDRKRWIAWKPNGHFAASPGGEILIGWHKNRKPDQAADFFPAKQFKDFLQPDEIRRVFNP